MDVCVTDTIRPACPHVLVAVLVTTTRRRLFPAGSVMATEFDMVVVVAPVRPNGESDRLLSLDLVVLIDAYARDHLK